MLGRKKALLIILIISLFESLIELIIGGEEYQIIKNNNNVGVLEIYIQKIYNGDMQIHSFDKIEKVLNCIFIQF